MLLIILLFFVNIFFIYGNELLPEISCSSLGQYASGCDQCFLGRHIYKGYQVRGFVDYYINNQNFNHIYYLHENRTIYEYRLLDDSVSFSHYFEFFIMGTGYSGERGIYIILPPNKRTLLYQASRNSYLALLDVNVNGKKTDRGKPFFRLDYIITVRGLIDGILSDPVTHRECVFYYPRYCGDNVVDNDRGEECDDGNNISGDGCDSNCKRESFPRCGDGIINLPGEECDDGNNNNGDGCDANCKREKKNYNSNCNWVDPPSIQIGEYLPIFWSVTGGFTEICNQENLGKYEKSSLTCHFKIKNGLNEIRTFQTSCYNQHSSNLRSSFKSKFLSRYSGSLAYPIQNYDGNYMYLLNGFNALGEYQIILEKIKASKVCSQISTGRYDFINTDINISTNTCLYNFSVTRPYLIQIGGLVTRVGNDVLDDFYYLNGNKVFSQQEINKLSSNNVLNFTGDIKKLLSNFKNKYENLAKKNINLTSLGFNVNGNLIGKSLNNTNIIFYDGNLIINGGNIINPTTLYVKGDVIINGNISGNLMLIVDGKIEFNGNCDKRLEVSGFYIAGEGFVSPKIINNNLNGSWCWDGRLLVRGNLLGTGILNLVNNRRSYLNRFFTYGNKIEIIRDGGSVVVVSNSNLYRRLPPGAQDLMSILRITR